MTGNIFLVTDKILLDADDCPLEIAVNSKSPVTFHLDTDTDRNTELLENLRAEGLSGEAIRKNIIQK